jgi:plasmid stabilization system protein ParE
VTPALFTPRAERELRDAVLWVEQDNPAAADALLAAAIATARRL